MPTRLHGDGVPNTSRLRVKTEAKSEKTVDLKSPCITAIPSKVIEAFAVYAGGRLIPTHQPTSKTAKTHLPFLPDQPLPKRPMLPQICELKLTPLQLSRHLCHNHVVPFALFAEIGLKLLDHAHVTLM
jgi:hypothetical protein